MIPEGFYRVRCDGRDGVAHCRHVYIPGVPPYESWSIMYLADIQGIPLPALRQIDGFDAAACERLEVIDLLSRPSYRTRGRMPTIANSAPNNPPPPAADDGRETE